MRSDIASRSCDAGYWQDAIATIRLRAAELRVEAARYDQQSPDDARWDTGPNFSGRHDTADNLDRLAEWLRGQAGRLPDEPVSDEYPAVLA